MKGPPTQRIDKRRIVPALVVLILTAIFIVSAYQYDERSAEFPLIVGWATLMLGLLDLMASMPTAVGRRMTSFLHNPRTTLDGEGLTPRREITAMLWIGGMVGLVWLVGFLVAIPIYTITFMTLHGRRPLFRSAIAAGATTLFVYVAFEWLLRYELYSGWLFK